MRSFAVKSLRVVVLASLLVLLAAPVRAADPTPYDHTFVTTRYSDAVLQLGNPAAAGYGWRRVTSHYNEPRSNDNSNPHRGVDLDIWDTWTVRSVYAGWVERISFVGTTDEALTMRLDVNGNGQVDDADNLSVTYMHITVGIEKYDQSGNLKFYEAGQEVGTIKDPNNHLHLGVVQEPLGDSPSNDRWDANTPYWRTVEAWNYGRDLDLLTEDYWNDVGNVFSIDGYFKRLCNGGWGEYPLAGVKLWHRQADGNSAWQIDDMTEVAGNPHRWQLDLTGGYPASSSVEVVAMCYRGDPCTNPSYNWAAWPPFYRHPSEQVSDWMLSASQVLQNPEVFTPDVVTIASAPVVDSSATWSAFKNTNHGPFAYDGALCQGRFKSS